MAQTIRTIISDALRSLQIIPAGMNASGDDAVDCMRHFNDMVRGWKASGTDITIARGDTESLVPFTDLTLDSAWPYGDQFLGGVKALLAVYVAAEFGRIISQTLQNRADIGWNAIMANFQTAQDAEAPEPLLYMPSTWPFGWGWGYDGTT